jgi:hypothetical protein
MDRSIWWIEGGEQDAWVEGCWEEYPGGICIKIV